MVFIPVDLVGRIAQLERVVEITSAEQDTSDETCWYRLNFEAIKRGAPTPVDPRKEDSALWPERHSVELLAAKRALDPVQFEALYQGNPTAHEDLLYGERLKRYEQLPETVKKASYTDTADTGDDYLCSFCYETDRDGMIYITDCVFTREPMECTEGAVASMFRRNATRTAYIESNNGGRGFARSVQRQAPDTAVVWFTQSANKEARILTNAPTVLHRVRFPHDWRIRWPELYRELTGYRRTYKANRNHDAADSLTGIIEKEVFTEERRTVSAFGFAR